MHVPEDLKQALIAASAQVVLGPRTAARDADFRITVPLPPAWPGADLVVERVESLRPDCPMPLEGGGAFCRYSEDIAGADTVLLRRADGSPAVAQIPDGTVYVAGWGDATALARILRPLVEAQGILVRDLPEGVRVRESETERFWFNYNSEAWQYEGRDLPAADVLIERRA